MDGNVYNHAGQKVSNLLRRLLQAKSKYYEDGIQIDEQESTMLLKNIQQARQEWLSAVASFDHAENDDMIDYYIYKMKACQVRYNYLLKQAKELGLRHDVYGA